MKINKVVEDFELQEETYEETDKQLTAYPNEDVDGITKEMIDINGVVAMLSALVKSEWDAIDMYNGMISAINDSNEPTKDQIINILKDIASEEYIHVGQLEKAIESINPVAATSIPDGKKEADEELTESFDISDYQQILGDNGEGYEIYRKVIKDENGYPVKGVWAAKKSDGEPFEITYDQAIGNEPIDNKQAISKFTGDTLLKGKESSKELPDDDIDQTLVDLIDFTEEGEVNGTR